MCFAVWVDMLCGVRVCVKPVAVANKRGTIVGLADLGHSCPGKGNPLGLPCRPHSLVTSEQED